MIILIVPLNARAHSCIAKGQHEPSLHIGGFAWANVVSKNASHQRYRVLSTQLCRHAGCHEVKFAKNRKMDNNARAFYFGHDSADAKENIVRFRCLWFWITERAMAILETHRLTHCSTEQNTYAYRRVRCADVPANNMRVCSKAISPTCNRKSTCCSSMPCNKILYVGMLMPLIVCALSHFQLVNRYRLIMLQSIECAGSLMNIDFRLSLSLSSFFIFLNNSQMWSNFRFKWILSSFMWIPDDRYGYRATARRSSTRSWTWWEIIHI